MQIDRMKLWIGVLIGFCCAADAHAATLVKDGKPQAIVVVPKDSDDTEKLAARELVDHIEKMSHAKLEVVPVEISEVAAKLEQFRKDGNITLIR